MTENYDEYLDEESREYAWKEKTKGFDQQAADLTRWQQEKANEQAVANQAKIFNDALKDAGVTSEQFADLISKDPSGTQEVFKDHVQSYVHKVTGRARNEKGQFVPGKPETANFQHGQSVQNRKTKQANLDELRAKSQKGALSHEDELSLIDSLLDGPL